MAELSRTPRYGAPVNRWTGDLPATNTDMGRPLIGTTNGVPNYAGPVESYTPPSQQPALQWAPQAAPSTPSLGGLQAASAAPAAAAAGGAKVPEPPPVTSGMGDGGASAMDSGLDRILGAAGGGMQAMNGLLRAGLGQRSRPMDSFVLAGKKAY